MSHTVYSSLAEVRAANENAGLFWFSKGAIEFFGTRFESELIGGRFFITSEQPPYGPRAYAIREALADGSIETIGTVAEFRSKGAALNALAVHRRREAGAPSQPGPIWPYEIGRGT